MDKPTVARALEEAQERMKDLEKRRVELHNLPRDLETVWLIRKSRKPLAAMSPEDWAALMSDAWHAFSGHPLRDHPLGLVKERGGYFDEGGCFSDWAFTGMGLTLRRIRKEAGDDPDAFIARIEALVAELARARNAALGVENG